MNVLQHRMYIGIKQMAEEKGWELISTNYINDRTKLLFKCPNGHQREITPNNFKGGRGCSVCSGCDPVSAKLFFENKIRELGGILIGEYTLSYEPVIVICYNGHICNPTPDSIKMGHGICHKCSTGQYNAELEFTDKIKQLGGRIISQYINNYTPITVICKNGHECSVYCSSIRLGYALCNTCNGSGGEQLIISALNYLGLKYIGQYSLPGKSFRYDFATGINCTNTVIEWDGEQHFKFVKHFHKTSKKFIYSQNCDREKTREIINLGSKMIRIDYTWGKKSIQEISQFIYLALQSNQQLIVSNPDMYQWLVYY